MIPTKKKLHQIKKKIISRLETGIPKLNYEQTNTAKKNSKMKKQLANPYEIFFKILQHF